MESFPNQYIFERDNYTCQYCGRSGASNFDEWNQAWFAIDHVKPKKHDGSNNPDNLVVACHTCNSVKGSDMCNSVEEGKEIIKRKNKVRKEWFNTHVLRSNEGVCRVKS